MTEPTHRDLGPEAASPHHASPNPPTPIPAESPADAAVATSIGESDPATVPPPVERTASIAATPIELAPAIAPTPDVTPPDPTAGPSRAASGARFQDARRAILAGMASRMRSQNLSDHRRHLATGAALVLALGLGLWGGRFLYRPAARDAAVSAQPASEQAAGWRQAHEDALRLGSELRSLRVAVDGIKAERDRARGELSAKQAQLGEKTDKLGSDGASRFARLSEQLERIERVQRDPARIGALTDRLDRIEKHLGVSSVVAAGAVASPPVSPATPTPPPKPVAASDTITQTGSLPEKPAPKPAAVAETDARKLPLDGWVLRDVDGGNYALVESRSGRVVEVVPGGMLPGVGKVEAIERRGRRWVVVTAKGYIAER